MRRLLLGFLILFLGCSNPETNLMTDTSLYPKDELLDWHEYCIAEINEQSMRGSRPNKIRLSLGFTYGHPNYILGVLEYDNSFVIYQKTNFKENEPLFESKGIRIRKSEYSKNWEKIKVIFSEIENERNQANRELDHAANWTIELNDTSYRWKTGKLADAKWVKKLYGLTPFDLPPIVSRITGDRK